MKTNPIEYSAFATVTIVIAQIVSGFLGISMMVIGVVGLATGSVLGSLLSSAQGVVYLGGFFALARVRNLGAPEHRPPQD